MIALIFWAAILTAGLVGITLAGLSENPFKFVSAVTIFAGAMVLNQVTSLLFWRVLVRHWTGFPVPRLLEQITLIALVVIAIGIIMVSVYAVPVTGVLTTSGLFIAIIGFALRNMISDLFTGIALGLERPFSVGDWIQVPDGTIGRVMEMNWRSTRLLTREEITVVIPNSELAISTFKNFSKPERAWRDEFDILLHQSVTTHQAERILLSAINQVPDIVAVNKPPEVRIVRFTENGIVWQVRFWVPDYQQMSRLRYEVQKAIARNMHYAGLSIPAEQVQVQSPTVAGNHGFDLLRRVDLFNSLTDDEVSRLNASMEQVLVLKTQPVVTAGETGDSLFIVREGLLEVRIRDRASQIAVAHLRPGSFFGEMSLLTGDLRHATVVAQVDSVVVEIRKKDFEPIIQSRPEIARFLTEIVEHRNTQNKAIASLRPADEAPDVKSLLARITAFFAIPGDDAQRDTA